MAWLKFPRLGGNGAPQEQERQRHTRRFGYHVGVVAVLIAGIAGSSVGFYMLLQSERKVTRHAFEKGAHNNVAAIRIALDRAYESLEASGTLFGTSREVTAEDFARFGERALSRNPALKALSWTPRVPAAARAAHEAAVRKEIPGYQIREVGAGGNFVPAVERDIYFPVRFSVDRTGQNAYGVDYSANPMQRAIMQEAMATNATSATAPHPLTTGEDKGVAGFILLRPVYRRDAPLNTREERVRNFIGFSTSVILISRQVNSVLDGVGIPSVHMALYDMDAPQDHRFLASWPDRGADDVNGPTAAKRNDLQVRDEIPVGGRRWLAVLTPAPGQFSLAPSWRPWTALGIGVLLSLLVAGYLTALHRYADAVGRQAVSDLLTGLYNRRYLEDFLQREILRAERKGVPVAALMIDIDFFKRVNDAFGHQAGDVVLAALGALIRARVRGSDVGCRYGGEEFLVVMPEADQEVAHRRAEDLRLAVKELDFVHEGLSLGRVTVSVGVAAYPAHARNAEELVKYADAALFMAKRAGRDCTVVFQHLRQAADAFAGPGQTQFDIPPSIT